MHSDVRENVSVYKENFDIKKKGEAFEEDSWVTL